jgi:hypothetical protein
MRFLLTEKKGCYFHNFLKETGRIYKLKILFIDYNNIFFKFKNEYYSLIRIEKKYFENKEKHGIDGYGNIIVLIIKNSKLCIYYKSIDIRPYDNSSFYNFENKKKYAIINFTVDGFKLKRKGLNFIEDKLKWIYKTIVEKLSLDNDEKYLIDNL